MTKRRFELTDGKSSKFWSIEVDGARVLVHYGRIGTDGRTSDKELADAEAANKHADKLIAQKLGKGYAEVGGSPVAKKSAKRGARTKAAKGLAQHFERVRATKQVIEDHGLGEAPLDGTVYVGTGKIVVEPAQIEELQRMLGDGVVVDGQLVVKGHLLLDDGCTLRADKVTCESMTLNECWVWVGRVHARDYVWLDRCASHGYAVDIDVAKTRLLLVDEGALSTGPVGIGTQGWSSDARIDASQHPEEQLNRALPEHHQALVRAAKAETVETFLDTLAAKRGGYAMAKPGRFTVERVHKNDYPAFNPVAIASDGEELYAHTVFKLWRSDADGGVAVVRASKSAGAYVKSLAVRDGVVWIGHADGIKRATEGGKTCEDVKVAKVPIVGLAFGPDGSLWAGGGYSDKGAVYVKPPRGKTFRRVHGPTAEVTSVSTTQHGVLVGDFKGGLWLGKDGTLEPIGSADAPIRDAVETTDGTILVLAGYPLGRDDEVTLLRSTGGITKFEASTIAPSLFTITQMPDGPVVAAGVNGTIVVSLDDGLTFSKLTHNNRSKDDPFNQSCVLRGAVYVGGNNNNLVRVVAGAGKKKAARKSTGPQSGGWRTTRLP